MSNSNETCKTCKFLWAGVKKKHNLCRKTWRYTSNSELACPLHESIYKPIDKSKTIRVITNNLNGI